MTMAIEKPAATDWDSLSLQEQFIRAMGGAATAVTIVTTNGEHGKLGQTVSAMSSLSSDPMSALVCINRKSPIAEAIEGNGVFAINILGRQHDHVADTFAGRPWPGKDRWDWTCGVWDEAPSTSPKLIDALAVFDCVPDQVIPYGTHNIYIGKVNWVSAEPQDPLVYHKRRYGKPLPVPPSEFADYPGSGPTYL